MDLKWQYKNFNMVTELEISGEFIYNGIHEIYRLDAFSNDGPTFYALYSLSVGIERLQKIVYVLWGMDGFDDKGKFEKSLITHSHTGLRDKINNLLQEKGEHKILNSRENEFLSLLCSFYSSARYERFNVEGEWDRESKILKEYIIKYVDKKDFDDVFSSERIIATEKVKELFGRVVGSISKKYYELIKKGSYNNLTYTYELRADSKASKIFWGNYSKNSLMQAQTDESIALKELLIYLRCTKDKNAFFKYIDEIEPLEFDPPLVLEYLQEIIKGNISQTLIDDVEYMYGEKGYSRDRVELVGLFGETTVLFDYPFVERCWTIIQRIKTDGLIIEDINKLKELKEYISEEDLADIIDEIIKEIEIFQNTNDKGVFINRLEELAEEYKKYLIVC